MSHIQSRRIRLALDPLDARDLPAPLTAAWAIAASKPDVSVAATAGRAGRSGEAVGDAVAAFAAARVGARVGGGECAHLATEALRAAGGRFLVFGGSRDYDWGTLVTRTTGTALGAVMSNPAARVRPGDVLQYTDARFRDGTRAPHHTAIVAAVDGAGRVTAVYQQNFAGDRRVTRQSLNLADLTAGTVKAYRPEARLAPAGVFRFTVVNNAGPAVVVTERAGVGVSAYWLSRTDTAWSYQTRRWVTTGGARLTLTAGLQTMRVEDGAAYEIYRGGDGRLAIRKLAS